MVDPSLGGGGVYFEGTYYVPPWFLKNNRSFNPPSSSPVEIDNFSILPGSESKLLKGLKLGCSGIITATCNVTSALARKVYDDFKNEKSSSENEKLQAIRTAFDETGDLISALHTLKSLENKAYGNLLPPLELLNQSKKEELIKKLKALGALTNKNIAA